MGQKKGYKQTPEHIEHKKRFGKDHHAWKGDEISDPHLGRRRARAMYPIQPCVVCGVIGERHHKDGDLTNNKKRNIKFLCRKHHMEEDGRLKKFAEYAQATTGERSTEQWKDPEYRAMMIAAQVKSNKARKGSKQRLTDTPHCDSKTGVRGVYERSNGTYTVCLRSKYLGTFKTLREAKHCVTLHKENMHE